MECVYCGRELSENFKRRSCRDCNRAYCRGYSAGKKKGQRDVQDRLREAVLS